MNTYCLKCKARTEDIDGHIEKNMMKSKCGICGTKKSRFISLQKGGKYSIHSLQHLIDYHRNLNTEYERIPLATRKDHTELDNKIFTKLNTVRNLLNEGADLDQEDLHSINDILQDARLYISEMQVYYNSQSGRGDIDIKLSSEAYRKPEDRAENVDGYQLDKGLSNKKTLVYNNPNTKQTIVAHRGTVLTDKNDLKNDAKLLTGNLESSKRVKNATKITKEAEKKYSDSQLSSTGHSLGSAVAQRASKGVSVENSKVTGYNSAVTPLDAVKNIMNNKECKNNNSEKCRRLRNVELNTTGIDPVSGLALLGHAGTTKVKKPKSINTHSLSNFQTGGCKGKKNCPCK
jgi:hypothetical protein